MAAHHGKSGNYEIVIENFGDKKKVFKSLVEPEKLLQRQGTFGVQMIIYQFISKKSMDYYDEYFWDYFLHFLLKLLY